MLDFGCVREFDLEFRVLYASLLMAVENDDLGNYHKTALELGFCMPEDGPEYVEGHFKLVKDLYSPYFKQGRYAIDKMNPFNLVTNFVKGVKLKGRLAPRNELVHLDRATLGVYSKLKAWNAKVDYYSGRTKYRDPHEPKVKELWANFS